MYAVGKGQHQADVEERNEDEKAKRKHHRWGDTDYPNYWGQWDKWEGPFYYSDKAMVGDGGKKGAYILGQTYSSRRRLIRGAVRGNGEDGSEWMW